MAEDEPGRALPLGPCSAASRRSRKIAEEANLPLQQAKESPRRPARQPRPRSMPRSGGGQTTARASADLRRRRRFHCPERAGSEDSLPLADAPPIALRLACRTGTASVVIPPATGSTNAGAEGPLEGDRPPPRPQRAENGVRQIEVEALKRLSDAPRDGKRPPTPTSSGCLVTGLRPYPSG